MTTDGKWHVVAVDDLMNLNEMQTLVKRLNAIEKTVPARQRRRWEVRGGFTSIRWGASTSTDVLHISTASTSASA